MTSLISKWALRHGVQMGLRQLWRDARSGQLWLLMGSVVLAVGAFSAVGFLADRMQAGLQRDARQLLGGDAVVVSDQPLPAAWLAKAQQLGLEFNTQTLMPSMARAPGADGQARLVALKAVLPGYPLRGSLVLGTGTGAAAGAVPAPGQVWVDAALLDALGLGVGQELGLGDRWLRVAGVIEREPDRGAGFMNFAPRVMLHAADLPSTGLVQLSSRVTYRSAVAGPEFLAFAAWARAQVQAGGVRGVQVETLDAGRPEMRQTLARATQFLQLVAMLAALLCAVAVALAAHQFAQQHLDACALQRVLGQSQRAIAGAYAVEFVCAGVAASVCGLLLGHGVQAVLVWWLQGLMGVNLPAPSVQPALLGLAMGLSLLVAFGLPPVLQLAQVPALRVLRRELGGIVWRSGMVGVAGVLAFAAVLLGVGTDVRLGLWVVLGFALALALFMAGAAAALWLLRKVLAGRMAAGRALAPAWRVASRQLLAQPWLAMLQVSSLSVGLLALALLVLLRTDVLASWRAATPATAPDRFVINVQPDQTSDFLAHLRQAGVQGPDVYPMLRGRLVAINGRGVQAAQFQGERAQRLVEREFNVSHAAQLPAHNEVVAGHWQAEQTDGVSVEQGLAQTLGLRLGDRLQFDAGGVLHEARITSLRKVDWASMRANFFVLFPLAQMPQWPGTWMAAFRSPEGQPQFERQLVQRFPNVTSVDVRASLAQVQRVLDQVIAAVEFMFGLTLAAGVLVLLAALGSGRAERERDMALMRVMGARRALLAQVQRLELLGVGALAGLMATGVALALTGGLTHWVLELPWRPALWAPCVGAAAGALLAWTAGSMSLRGVLRQPPLQTLRR